MRNTNTKLLFFSEKYIVHFVVLHFFFFFLFKLTFTLSSLGKKKYNNKMCLIFGLMK
jgi:hypothetical protein